jgi:hypothetical protein
MLVWRLATEVRNVSRGKNRQEEGGADFKP